MFKIVDLDEVLCQREGNFFIDVVNKTGVVDVDSNTVKVLKSRFLNLNVHDFSKQALQILAENWPA